ncbi:tail protein X [Tissierella praeacuta]|uniref:tail protein X n=1 Tax=Tissierella praeacuta TaxID=43131 RepID=UPI0028A8A03E|nr:tail protein X [Tissierella praeacuta]
MDQERIKRSYTEVIEQDIYITVQGDTWDIIALKVYGSEKYMSYLLKSNPKYISIMFFSAGVEIICPDIEIDVVENLPPWKR